MRVSTCGCCCDGAEDGGPALAGAFNALLGVLEACMAGAGRSEGDWPSSGMEGAPRSGAASEAAIVAQAVDAGVMSAGELEDE